MKGFGEWARKNLSQPRKGSSYRFWYHSHWYKKGDQGYTSAGYGTLDSPELPRLAILSAGAGAASSVLSALGYTTAAKIVGLIGMAAGIGAAHAAGAGLSAIIKNFAERAASLPVWQRVLSGISTVGAIANSFSSSRKSNNRNTCKTIQGLLRPFADIFDGLWKKTQNSKSAQAPKGLERGGLIGFPSDGTVIAGKGVPPVFREYSGAATKSSLPGFSPWARSEISRSPDVDFVFWVHTHPAGTARPSAGAGMDLDVAAPYKIGGTGVQTTGVGLDGIVITANKVVVFNQVGKYCEFNR